MKKLLSIIIGLLFAVSGYTMSQPKDCDLDFIYKAIVENHPGIYNEQDPQFKKNLEEKYCAAKKDLKRATKVKDQKTIIADFIRSFNDTHLRVRYTPPKLNRAIAKNRKPFQITHLAHNVVWIALPTFDELDEKQRRDFHHIVEQLPLYRNKAAIVFDVRKNTGGDSSYGSKVVHQLFGEKYAIQQKVNGYKDTYVDWRVSKGNIAYIESSPSLKEVAVKMKKNLNKNQHYYKEMFVEETDLKNISKTTHSVTAKIFVMIDSGNVSAVLDFIDELKMMEASVTLVGQTTKADRLYMDVRDVELPSGLGCFTFPMKVYRNRPRQDNIPYEPDICCEAFDTQQLQQLIFQRIAEEDKN